MNTKLPNEILANIFRLNAERDIRLPCCRLDYHRYHQEEMPLPLQDTLNASQVCHYWRTVVINSPELWRHFVNPHHKHPEWTQIVLQRSKPYGITYRGTVSGAPVAEEDLVLEAANADRLDSYAVALESLDDWSHERDCSVWNNVGIPKKWPKLKFLCIAHRADEILTSSYGEDCDADDDLILPIFFPSLESTPGLERLHLHRCFVQFDFQITDLCNLMELRVHYYRAWNVFEWLDFLPQLPHLKILALDNVISDLFVSGVEEDRIVRLNLEEFCLKDHVSRCAKMIDHLDLKTSRIFQLACFEIGWEEKEEAEYVLSRVSPIIKNLLQSNPMFQRCALSMAGSDVECFGFPVGYSGENWPDLDVTGAPFCDAAIVDLNFWTRPSPLLEGGHAALTNMLRPIHDSVEAIDITDNERDMFLVDNFLSDLLWKSSHRLRRLTGVNFFAFKIIYQIMFSENHVSDNPGRPGVSFLQALEEMGLWVDEDAPEEYPLHHRIVEFCKRKKETGNPLLVLTGIPARDYKKSRRVAPVSDVVEQLIALGVEAEAAPEYKLV